MAITHLMIPWSHNPYWRIMYPAMKSRSILINSMSFSTIRHKTLFTMKHNYPQELEAINTFLLYNNQGSVDTAGRSNTHVKTQQITLLSSKWRVHIIIHAFKRIPERFGRWGRNESKTCTLSELTSAQLIRRGHQIWMTSLDSNRIG